MSVKTSVTVPVGCAAIGGIITRPREGAKRVEEVSAGWLVEREGVERIERFLGRIEASEGARLAGALDDAGIATWLDTNAC
jgi:hypothetical protein